MDGNITVFQMVAALERVNLCEGRTDPSHRAPVKSGKGTELNIYAPCTCLEAIGKTDVCASITVQEEARAQCEYCKNVRPLPLHRFSLTNTTTHQPGATPPRAGLNRRHCPDELHMSSRHPIALASSSCLWYAHNMHMLGSLCAVASMRVPPVVHPQFAT